MKTYFFETENWENTLLEGLCRNVDYQTVKQPLTLENAAHYADADIVSCFIYSRLDRPVLEKLASLKLIATRSTGVDHIDIEYCNQRGIVVANVPAYGAHTVAEHVFALLLSLSRHMRQAIQQTRDGNFHIKGLRGFDLYGKTLGIIGAGAIGLRTAEIARGFGMNVLAHDIHPRMDTARQMGFTYTSFDRLLAQSDIISLHVPGTKSTHHLLSDREFGLMKEGVVIINTARGANIDVKALLRALASGRVASAGLDVLPNEPVIREEAELLRSDFKQEYDLETLLVDHALLHHKNVIVTPHTAFYTREAVERILETTADNIHAFMDGSALNIVKPPSLPEAAA
ncbi:MAG: hydroxyacid dehydrogenase [Alphaproteobacteria bacterium]|nr:MAG: hydroxyacid dehydrogenase [Alphaproteobacteria bacterium]